LVRSVEDWRGEVRFGAVRHGRRGEARCGKVGFGTVSLGMAWYGRRGEAWCGEVVRGLVN